MIVVYIILGGLVFLGLIFLCIVIAAYFSVKKEQKQEQDQQTANQAAEKARQKDADPFAREAPVSGDISQLQIGHTVGFGGVNYVTRGRADFNEDGFRWTEFFLDDGTGTRRWLSVERDPDLEVFLWESVIDDKLKPKGNKVTWNGKLYKLEEKGTAHFTATAGTDLPSQGTVSYADYLSDSGDALSFESYNGGDKWEVSHGVEVPHGTLEIWAHQRD